MEQQGIDFEYEKLKLAYTIPAVDRIYHPDFQLKSNKIILEAKGIFDAADRHKMLLVRDAHPELDIRFIFYNANSKIYHGSKTTLAQWADKHGFKWAHRVIPAEWLRERTTK